MDSWPSVLDWVDTITSGIFCVDALGNISLWNQAMVELLGYTSDELRNSSLLCLLCDDADQAMTRLLRKEKIATDHFVKMIHKSNHQILAKITVCSQRRNNGEWIGHLFFVEDQRTSFHDDTSESPAFHDENNKAFMRGVEDSGMVDLHRERASDNFDLSLLKEVSEKNLTQCLDHRGEEQAKWISIASLHNTHSDNHHASINSLNLRNQRADTSDKLITTQVLSDTLINQRSSESLLYTILVELSELFEQANTPIFGVDVNGVVNEWNIQMSTTTGYCKEDSMHQNFAETYVAVSFRQRFQEIIGNCLQGCQSSSFELDIVTSDGHTRHLLVNGTTRRDFFGKIVGVLFFAQDVTERLQHDRAVAAIARELRQLIDTANAPIFGIDVNGRVNEWNDKTAEITGFSADEAFNQPLVETFIVPAFQSSVNRVLRDALEGNQTSNYELEFRTKDNEIRYLLVNATTRKDAENNVIGVVGVAQDVTEAAMHDRAVAVMANELRQLIDAANAPIFGIDIDGDVNEWNNKTAEITGYTKEEAFDCNLVDTFIVPTHRASVKAVMDKALKGEEASNYELEFRTKSNEIRYLLVNATTRRDAENNVVGVVGVAQDVTETVHRDRAVASMAKELRQLIETANAPIFGIDFDGNVNEWNYKIADVTGYSKQEAFDQPLVETFIAPLMRDQVSKIMNEALSGIETSNYELEMLTKSKEIRVLLVNATTRRDPDDNVVGVVGVAQDVTEDRKHAEELREMQCLQAIQEAKVETERNMTAYFAHELRNPLGAIDSALNAMPDDVPEAAKKLISGMKLCTGFMASIMNNLLDVRKMEEGKMTLHIASLSLQATLKSIYEMLLPSVKPNVEFRTNSDTEGKDWVLGDSHRIQQVMTNVITNAIKYTITGSITVSFRWIDDFVCFTCDDTGPGIPISEQAYLFERYVQRGGAPGTGLGLAIAKHLATLFGGSIQFESDPRIKPGTSCIVMMRLQQCPPPDAFIQESEEVLDSELSILIVDDINVNRVMLKRRILKGIAPKSIVKEAATGEEALLICGSEKFDVIVVDQYMDEAGGVMVGTDVVFAMRRIRIDSIIIGCSGNDIDDQFLEAGADWVWKKPLPSNSVIISQLRKGLASKVCINS